MYNLSKLRVLLTCSILLVHHSPAQQPKSVTAENSAEFTTALTFEATPKGQMPGGWATYPMGTVFADDKVVHSGHGAVRIERNADSANDFSALSKSITVDFSGDMVELRGFLKTENVSGFVGLWLREDGDISGLPFDNMQQRHVAGTIGWAEFSVKLPLHPEARSLVFGALLSGTGKMWADDLQLLVDDKAVWQAAKVERSKTAYDTDHEFDNGSGITIASLTPVQIDNLVILGRMWGFLKYYDARVTSGQKQWDYELFRILPAILEAPDHAAANATLLKWVESLGPIAPCHPCAKVDESFVQLRSDLDWINHSEFLGPELSKTLQVIRDNRAPGKQFFVSRVFPARNPTFVHEPAYSNIRVPDSGFQLLALFRFWNIFEYWSPNRNVIGEDWTIVLAEFVPRFALARDNDAYKLELFALIARARDGHANLWGSHSVLPPTGKCALPLGVRFIGSTAVISELLAGPDQAAGLKPGDVLTAIDGTPLTELVEKWKPYYSGSNDVFRLRAIGWNMTRGECGETEVGVRRGDQNLKIKIKRILPTESKPATAHDLPGATFRLLSRDVAYLKLSSVKRADCPHYIESAAGTKGLIIDIRNYPSEFVVFTLGSLLVDSETNFVRFTEADLSNPGTFHWTQPVLLKPAKPHYAGKVVILVDEPSASQAEYTAMAFRSAPGAIVVGSTTAGADADVSRVMLPGSQETGISGIGVFYADKRPTQRIGILPNIEVQPTIAGLRDGRDEVLEEALRKILGSNVPEAEIQKLAKP